MYCLWLPNNRTLTTELVAAGKTTQTPRPAVVPLWTFHGPLLRLIRQWDVSRRPTAKMVNVRWEIRCLAMSRGSRDCGSLPVVCAVSSVSAPDQRHAMGLEHCRRSWNWMFRLSSFAVASSGMFLLGM